MLPAVITFVVQVVIMVLAGAIPLVFEVDETDTRPDAPERPFEKPESEVRKMPKITLCDRCGRLSKDDKHVRLFLRRCKWRRIVVEAKPLDVPEEIYLCGDCAREFDEWMTEGLGERK